MSARSRPDYIHILETVLSYELKNKKELRTVLVTSVSARSVDRLYEELQKSKRVARRLNTANQCMKRMARAWDVVQRLYPADVPETNPFRDVELTHSRGTTRAASRSEAYALHDALVANGHPHLAVVPLVCFELHQRPENVIAGHLTWNDYRPSDRRDAIRIEHHKTGAEVWQPLKDGEHDLYPELCKYLDGLERLGVPVVLRNTTPALPYRIRHARALVRKAADAAGLPHDLRWPHAAMVG